MEICSKIDFLNRAQLCLMHLKNNIYYFIAPIQFCLLIKFIFISFKKLINTI